MRHIIAIFLLAILLSQGCTALRPPQPMVSPLPEVSISPPSYLALSSSTPNCPRRLCTATLGEPVLVFAENRINRTTYQARRIPLDIPECGDVEVAFDNSSIKLEKREVASPDQSNYFNLYYFVPYRRGTYNVRIKTACEIRGTVFSIDAR